MPAREKPAPAWCHFWVEMKDERGRWKKPRISAHHATLEAAIRRVTICDEDGFFSASFRIRGEDGSLFTQADWRNLREARSK